MIRIFRIAHTAGPTHLELCAVVVLMCAAPARAADHARLPEAQAAYTRDRAECLSRKGSEDRATCLREAGAALQESRRGGLTDEQAQFERNRLARCAYQPPKDRNSSACAG